MSNSLGVSLINAVQRSRLRRALRTLSRYCRSWTAGLAGVASGGSVVAGAGTEAISSWSVTGISGTVPTILAGWCTLLNCRWWRADHLSFADFNSIGRNSSYIGGLNGCRPQLIDMSTPYYPWCHLNLVHQWTCLLNEWQPLTDVAVYPSHSLPWYPADAVG